MGIGGIGMSGIARILLDLGYIISGSDIKENQNTAVLRELGARIFVGHSPDNLDPSTEVVVYSSAVREDNPEIRRARELGIPVIPRGEMLAELFRLKEGIAVSGSHGKTTTTSMIASILETAGFDPTVIIGGKLKRVGGNAKLGRGDLLISEADESDGSFLKLSPVVAVVTNIDREHLDFYGDYRKLVASFDEFINSVPFYGFSVVNADDPQLESIASRTTKKVITYSVQGRGDILAENLTLMSGRYAFDILVNGEKIGSIHLGIAGKHNVYNALASIAVAIEIGVDFNSIRSALESFSNAERRMDFKGYLNGSPVFDDYGHHPTEIRCVIQAVREMYPDKELLLVFQPHRYSRTHLLFEEFIKVLGIPEKTYLLDIFPASEVNTYNVSSRDLAERSGAVYVGSEKELHDILRSESSPEKVILFMGAGDISAMCDRIMKVSGTFPEDLPEDTARKEK